MIYLLLIVHAIFFTVILVLRLLSVFTFPLTYLSLALFLPISGEICCLIVEILYRSQKAGSRHGNLESMRHADVFQSEVANQSPEPDNVVPVSDALALDSAGTKRDVLMQVIMQEENTKQNTDATSRYADVLSQAKASGDTEVVHYAATAITQMQDAIEADMHTCDQKLAEDPDNEETLDQYADLIESGLRSSVWSGQMLEIQRTHLRQILEKKYRVSKKEEDGLRLAGAYMDAGLYGDAWSRLQQMGITEKSAGELSDDAFLTRLRYAYEMREENAFLTLLSEKRAQGGYQTEKIRSVLAFFDEREDRA